MLSIDCSNYTDPLTPNLIQALKDAGIGLVIVQSVDPPAGFPPTQTIAQIKALTDAGIPVDAYIWLWFDLDTADIQHKLDLISGLSVRQLWLDVEDAAAGKYDQATTEAKVQAALDLCDAYPALSGLKTGVYSGRWFWADQRYMANTTAFSDRSLWDSNYDGQADTAVGFKPYGGWSGCAIKQFVGTSTVSGVGGVDQNVLSPEEEALVIGNPPDPTPDPAPDPAPQGDCDWGWNSKKDLVVGLAGELQAVAAQIRAAALRKGGPRRADVLPLADAVQSRADQILS